MSVMVTDAARDPLARVRILGAAEGLRKRTGMARYPIYQSDYDDLVAAIREFVSDDEFEAAWEEGVVVSAQNAIAYARRGPGERRRPSSGWAALTPTERDVVRLIGEGPSNKDIAQR